MCLPYPVIKMTNHYFHGKKEHSTTYAAASFFMSNAAARVEAQRIEKRKIKHESPSSPAPKPAISKPVLKADKSRHSEPVSKQTESAKLLFWPISVSADRQKANRSTRVVRERDEIVMVRNEPKRRKHRHEKSVRQEEEIELVSETEEVIHTEDDAISVSVKVLKEVDVYRVSSHSTDIQHPVTSASEKVVQTVETAESKKVPSRAREQRVEAQAVEVSSDVVRDTLCGSTTIEPVQSACEDTESLNYTHTLEGASLDKLHTDEVAASDIQTETVIVDVQDDSETEQTTMVTKSEGSVVEKASMQETEDTSILASENQQEAAAIETEHIGVERVTIEIETEEAVVVVETEVEIQVEPDQININETVIKETETEICVEEVGPVHKPMMTDEVTPTEDSVAEQEISQANLEVSTSTEIQTQGIEEVEEKSTEEMKVVEHSTSISIEVSSSSDSEIEEVSAQHKPVKKELLREEQGESEVMVESERTDIEQNLNNENIVAHREMMEVKSIHLAYEEVGQREGGEAVIKEAVAIEEEQKRDSEAGTIVDIESTATKAEKYTHHTDPERKLELKVHIDLHKLREAHENPWEGFDSRSGSRSDHLEESEETHDSIEIDVDIDSRSRCSTPALTEDGLSVEDSEDELEVSSLPTRSSSGLSSARHRNFVETRKIEWVKRTEHD